MLEDFPFVTSQMGRRNPLLGYMHYAVSYSYNLLTNAAVYYNSDVFSSEIASFRPTISFFNFYFTYVVCLNFALSLDATVYTTTVKRNWYEPI